MQRGIDIGDDNYRYRQSFFSKYDGPPRVVPYSCNNNRRDINKGGYMYFAKIGMMNRIDMSIIAKILNKSSFRNGCVKHPKRSIKPGGYSQ